MFEKELKQDDAARIVGRSKTYLVLRINGHEPFNFEDAAKLAAVLGIPQHRMG